MTKYTTKVGSTELDANILKSCPENGSKDISKCNLMDGSKIDGSKDKLSSSFKSMTGYGRAAKSSDICNVVVEIKSVNSRYSDAHIHLPRVLSSLEIPIKTLTQDTLVRGKADVSINVKFETLPQEPKLNSQIFQASLGVLQEMISQGKLDGSIKLEHILSFPNLVDYEDSSNIADIKSEVFAVVADALVEIDKMRSEEGRNLEKDILAAMATLERCVSVVDKAKEGLYEYWFERFQSKVEEFLTDQQQERVVQEAAIHAEKADIKEEIARLISHHKQFYLIMQEFPCGKKLDFLCQEMNREWNTIASKSIKSEIINIVVEAKAAVDAIREQIQNIV